jgi:hypothetical protein
MSALSPLLLVPSRCRPLAPARPSFSFPLPALQQLAAAYYTPSSQPSPPLAAAASSTFIPSYPAPPPPPPPLLRRFLLPPPARGFASLDSSPGSPPPSTEPSSPLYIDYHEYYADMPKVSQIEEPPGVAVVDPQVRPSSSSSRVGPFCLYVVSFPLVPSLF